MKRFLRRVSPRRSFALLALAGLVLGTQACSDSANSPPDGPAPGIEFVSLAWPADLTPDGSIALIQDLGRHLFFYHTATQELEYRTQVGDDPSDFATAISDNGVVTAHYGSPVRPAIWTRNGEWTEIASAYTEGCDQMGGAWDVSADGMIVVGLVFNKCAAEAFRWDARGSGIMTPLQRLGASFPGSTNPPANRASVVSGDGTTIAGWAQTSAVDRWPAIWRADGTGFLLPGTVLDNPGEVLSITHDGHMVAGTWGSEAFYWTEGTGVVNMGQLPGSDPYDPQYPNAIAAGGKLIFGGAGSPWFSIPRAWVWTEAAGMRPLIDVMTENGITVPEGTVLTNVIAASDDGTVVLGVAWDANYHQVSFILHLPVTAYGL